MNRPRYVVVNQEGRWLIRQAGRHFSAAYSSRSQALNAAIEYAERDGQAGHVAEVLVRQEDDHFVTAWACGESADRGDAERPIPQRAR